MKKSDLTREYEVSLYSSSEIVYDLLERNRSQEYDDYLVTIIPDMILENKIRISREKYNKEMILN